VHLDILGHDVKAFPAVDDPAAVTSVKLWKCKLSASPVRRFENLQGLEILNLTDASLDLLAGLARLRHLTIIHLPKVPDLQPLRRLGSLEVLRLHTLPSWDSSGKRTVVPSIEPIAALPSLRHLELFSVVPEDRSLAPLELCRTLVTARFQGFPKREVARFEAATGLANDFAPKASWST
jgi:hypothetical protein